jgi:hypothetical protein
VADVFEVAVQAAAVEVPHGVEAGAGGQADAELPGDVGAVPTGGRSSNLP